MLSWYIKEIGPLSCVLQIYFPIVVLGHHEEMGQDKRSTTQWTENIAASRKAATLQPSRCD